MRAKSRFATGSVAKQREALDAWEVSLRDGKGCFATISVTSSR